MCDPMLRPCRTVTDWNNSLKLGYDPGTETYPDWLTSQVRKVATEVAATK